MKTIYWVEGPWLGRLAIVTRPRGNEWLNEDIRLWRRNGIDVVVSLLTTQESRELGLSQEAFASERQGVQFLAFPIQDRSVPASREEMIRLIEQINTFLVQGKTVAIHCRQGIGRSGLLAASLLVQAGMDVDRAFAQIEKERGVPVPDTHEQRQWVERFARLSINSLIGEYIPAFE